MIPKILHYVWVGPKPLPEGDRRRIERWRQLHPRWEIRAWGNDDLDLSSPYLRGAFALRAWNRVSDYTRVDAPARFGGVYLDTDFDVLRPLDPFTECSAFLGFQAGDELPAELVAGGLFGAEAGHWLPTSIRDYFNERLDGRVDLNSFTGPGLVTQILRDRGLDGYSDEPIEVAGVTLLPKRYFYPYSWKEDYCEDVITADTYAVHRWAATWVDDDPSFVRRLRRNVLDRLARHTPDLALTLSRFVAWFGTRWRPASVARPQLTAPDWNEASGYDVPNALPLFDSDHYLGQLDSVVEDPLAHYVRIGWMSGLDPHTVFSTSFYLAGNPDVAAAGVCPLVHYARHGAAEGRQPHPLFDVDFYRAQAPDVVDDPLVHYLREGWTAGLDPHPLFSTRFYLESNPDVAAGGLCPLVHYIRHGGVENRRPHPLFSPWFYRQLAPSLDMADNPLVHFLLVGRQHRRDPSEWFDTDHYLSARPDVAASGTSALVHYVRFGWRERCNPHPAFDVESYLAAHPDVRDRDIEPLSHYLTLVLADGQRSHDGGTAIAYPATIVIPVLRQRDDWLETSVRSALAQTIPCEVVVVTSPMTPQSNLAVLTRLAEGCGRLAMRAQRRPGFAAAMNAGVERATAPRVGFLLSDDWLEPEAVAACVRSTADVVSTARRCFAEDGVRELVHLRRTASLADFLALPTLEQKADYLTHFFLIRREVLLAVGGLDESLGDTPGVDDYDLIWVLLEQHATVDVVERFVYNYRDHGGERLTLRSADENQRTLESILSKHGITGPTRDAMIARKSRWFGKPLDAVARPAPTLTKRATLAVCILFFERPEQTIECLESLGDGGPPVYVWNNGSSPTAREAVGRYARAHDHLMLIDSPVNLGVAAGRNRLIDASREELLLFLDSDIIVETSEWATVLLDRSRAWPEAEALVPSLFDAQANRADLGGMLVIQDDRFLHVSPAPEGHMNFFPGGAACVRRTLFERLGQYDESIFVGLEDYELAIRAMRTGTPICARGVPEVHLHHDRRRAQTAADARAAHTRYSLARVKEAYERVWERHGLRYDADWQGWLEQQLDRVVGADRTTSQSS